MQVRHFFIFLCFGFCFLFSTNVEAQRVTTNEKGEKIVVYPDGSWRYYQSIPDEDTSKPKKAKKVKTAKVKTPKVKKPKIAKVKTKKVKGPKQPKVKGNKSKLAKTKTKSNKKKGGKRGKVVKSKPIKGEFDPVAEAASRDAAIIRAERAAVEESKARKIYEDAGFNLLFVEEELSKSLEEVPMNLSKVENLELKLANVKAEENAAKRNYKEAQKNAKFSEKLIDMSMDKRDKLVAAQRMKSNQFDPNEVEETVGLNDAINENTSRSSKRENVASSKTNKKKGNAMLVSDVMVNPPARPCNVAFEGLDEFSGIRRKDLKPEQFFTYTNDQLATYIKGGDYITCNGNLSAGKGGLVYLTLKFVISSEFAQREFGVLEKGSLLTLKMINGSTVRLYNNKTDTGVLNTLDSTTSYKAQFAMTSSQQKDLMKSELDKVRVVWSTGYEDYEIYEVDFLINQLNCLQDK